MWYTIVGQKIPQRERIATTRAAVDSKTVRTGIACGVSRTVQQPQLAIFRMIGTVAESLERRFRSITRFHQRETAWAEARIGDVLRCTDADAGACIGAACCNT